ncbi:hypothetical protein VZT92_017153 [Zoarces viviparus]|uniref:Uncharacterized protein n=1 Tax=Zoarces viviparus TaxID=48416 RepID=A0AAW1ERW1_ZOAVI
MDANLHANKLVDEAESPHGKRSEHSLLDMLTETLRRLEAVRRCRDHLNGTVGGRRCTGDKPDRVTAWIGALREWAHRSPPGGSDQQRPPTTDTECNETRDPKAAEQPEDDNNPLNSYDPLESDSGHKQADGDGDDESHTMPSPGTEQASDTGFSSSVCNDVEEAEKEILVKSQGSEIKDCFSRESFPRGVLGASVNSTETSNELLIVLGSRDKQRSVLDKVTVRNQLHGLVSFELTENCDRLLVVRLLSPLRPCRLASLAEELKESVCCYAVTVVLRRRRDEPHAVLAAALPGRELGWELSKLRCPGLQRPLGDHRVRTINRPITVRVKLCEETDSLSDSLLLWLSGELSEEDVALLVLSLRLRRSAAQLVKLRAWDSLSAQAFHVLAIAAGRTDLARELLLRQAAATRQVSLT